MKQFKKLLSVILAAIMVLSSVSLLANAYGTAWKDAGITEYNLIDKPVLTTEQYATAALDEVDRMLDEEQLIFTEEDIIVGSVDLTSINATLDSVNTLLDSSLWKTASDLVGDLGRLDKSALTARRLNNGSDVAVINSLLRFLYDNKQLFIDFVKGNLNLGNIVGMFVDLSDFSIDGLAKDALYEATYGVEPDGDVTLTIDKMAQDLIDALIITGYDDEEPLLPSCTTDDTDISSGTMLSFLDNALKLAYNEWLVPRANDVWLDDIDEMLADHADEIEKYKSYFNLTDDGKCNFTFQPYEFDDSKLVLEQFNDILGSIINLALNDDIGFEWESGDNSMILTNIINIGKEVLAVTGDEFFEPFVTIYTADELEGMTDMEIVSYVARTILNSSIDGVWIPDTADTLVKVGNYLVKDLMATQLPERDYSSESAYPVDDINTLYSILSDYGIKALNDNPGLGLDYGIGLDALATAGANWAIDNYGGLLSGVSLSTSKTGWANLDTLVFSLFNRNWIDASKFPGGVTFESLLKDGIIGNIINLELDEALELLTFKGASSEFNYCTPKQFILNLVGRILNVVFPGILPMNTAGGLTVTSLEGLLDGDILGGFVDAIFSNLYNRRTSLVKAILPIVTDVLDLTCEQTFKTPSFSLESFYNTSTANVNFKITNRSYGINTGYTDASGNFHQDSRYAIKVYSVTTDKTALKATIAGGTQPVLYGGDSVNVNIAGSVTGAMNTVVTIEYDILKEDGLALTPNHLQSRIYTTFSRTASDEETTTSKTATGGAFSVKDTYTNVYITNPKDIEDIEFFVKNSSGGDLTFSAYHAAAPARPTLYLPLIDTAAPEGFDFVKVNTETKTILDGAKAGFNPYVVEGYSSKDETHKEYMFTTKGYQKYAAMAGVQANSVNVNAQVNVCLYDDHGLPSLFSREVNAQRQESDYDSTAFATYLTAMSNAAALVNGAKNNNNFCTATGNASKYAGVYESLNTAVENLEATAKGGVADLRARLTQIDPSNKGLEYTDAGYSFFSADNYKTYTWSNFRSEYKSANKFVEQYEEGGKLYGEKPAALDLALKTWRLNNYYSRLLPVAPSAINLDRAVGDANAKNYDKSLYTEESFAKYETAKAFADSVVGDASSVQNKINVAYVELIEAQKRLILNEGGGEEEIVVNPSAESPIDPDYSVVSFENSEGQTLLYGIAPEDQGYELAQYFNFTGVNPADLIFDVEEGILGTGKLLTISDANENVIAEFIIVIKGEVDGDGEVGSLDTSALLSYSQGFKSFSDSGDSAYDIAADIDLSGEIDSLDYSASLSCTQGFSSINFASNEF